MKLSARARLRVVSVIDIIKGAIILVAAFGILQGGNHVLEDAAMTLLKMLDSDPHLGAPKKFLELMQAADLEQGMLISIAVAYALLRFIEAYGLWFMRNWARWLGLFGAGIYVPFEVYYFIKGPSWTTFIVMLINCTVLWLLWPRKKFAVEKSHPEF
jgi:uncharacterized membrane protein (DUF2068 family)